MDWAAQAYEREREAFCAEHPHPFLFGVTMVVPPRGGSATLHMRQITIGPELPGDTPCKPKLMVEPVRKTRPGFETTISIGRTVDNDVVLEDVQVSKLHALVTVDGGRLLLQDAGSLNGTFVGTQRIYQKDGPQPISIGEVVRFGTLTFTLLDAAGCWDAVHKHPRS